jgi:hypothetical protein
LAQWPLTWKFPSALYLLNECRFWIGICRNDMWGQRWKVCRIVESWWCNFTWKNLCVATFHLCPTY